VLGIGSGRMTGKPEVVPGQKSASGKSQFVLYAGIFVIDCNLSARFFFELKSTSHHLQRQLSRAQSMFSNAR
jgi:hypothetical protein